MSDFIHSIRDSLHSLITAIHYVKSAAHAIPLPLLNYSQLIHTSLFLSHTHTKSVLRLGNIPYLYF